MTISSPVNPDDDVKMRVEDALRVLADLRSDHHIVVTNQGSSRLWPRLSNHALDFNYNPSTMGGAVPLGLGLALAQRDHEVTVVSGDGSLLMSLGCLVTVIDSGATNISVVLLDNGIYEVTGGQATPSAGPESDFTGLARAAGFPNVSEFWLLEDWRRRCKSVFSERGPRFMTLNVSPLENDCLNDPTPPIREQIERLSAALSG